MDLIFLEAPKRFAGLQSKIYIYEDKGGNKYLYKELTSPLNDKIKNELIAHELAKLVGINVLDFIKHKELPDRRPGLLMNYLETALTLSDFKEELNIKQKQELRKIILFDIWIGNTDRHTANILVTDKLVAFDHTNLFGRSEKVINFLKIDIGLKLDKDYLNKLENLMRLKLMTKEAFTKWFGFTEADFERIRKINDQELKGIVGGEELAYLVDRKSRIADFPFT